MSEHIYYRSTNPGSSKRISTGNPTWDNNLFVLQILISLKLMVALLK